jgi:PAS domain S-box-containing protein
VSRREVDSGRVILAAEPLSAAVARRHVRAVLDEAGAAGLVDQAQLLVSEVVTNAVLHSRGPIGLSVVAAEYWVSIEVSDGSSSVPSPRHYDDQATTGRGLEIVEFVATRWGVAQETGGKVVWFELGRPPAGRGQEVRSGHTETSEVPTGVVRLLNMPPDLVLATLERGDALLREFALLEMGEEGRARGDRPRRGGALPTAAVLEVAAAAVAAGHSGVDVAVTLPLVAADLALERLGVADEAERLASSGELLAPPALPEIAACRRWLLGQITLQLRGEAPTPWELPGAVTSRVDAVIDPGALRVLQEMGPGAIGADLANYIVFVDRAAAELLGWERDALVTQRLTTIIPHRLRQAHLAGFARYQLTGQAHILDKPVRLSALRRDGTTVEIELTITPIGRPRPTLFAARLCRI